MLYKSYISLYVCSDNKNEEVLKLFLDEKSLISRLMKQKYIIRSLQSHISVDTLFETINKDLRNARKHDHPLLCRLEDVKNIKCLMVTINSIIDPKGYLRKSLGVGTKTLFPWSPTTFIHKPRTGSSANQEQEIKHILRWIKEKSSAKLNVMLKPDDNVLFPIDGSMTDVVMSALETIIPNPQEKPHEHENSTSEMVVCFTLMDAKVVNYQEYVRKCMLNLIRENGDTIRRLICILYYELLGNKNSMEDIIPDYVILKCEKTNIYSVNDPRKKAVTFLIVDIEMKDRSDRDNLRNGTRG